MKFYADLHIHSKYSRATSKELTPENLVYWSKLKGLNVVGTGDFVHPGWLQELQAKIEPAEEGFFRIKQAIEKDIPETPRGCHGDVRFVLSAEISSIYKKGKKVRKVHNVVFVPSFAAALKLQARLEKIGNIRSDGRPILGLDSRDLLEILLETDPNAFLIPAHIWTPWFSVLGSKSGFDSIEECFDDLAEYIYAIETGLSSDPLMNWRLSQLDRFALISNSDAHSPSKLAREANIFNAEFSYMGILNALRDKKHKGLEGTIEFFPEEGKYHCDGHRNCQQRLSPKETIKAKGLCPVCGKPVTVGVLSRVEELADRKEGEKPKNAKPFYHLIPMVEVVAQAQGFGPNSKAVQTIYQALLNNLGNELSILQDENLKDIEKVGGVLVAEGIKRMRMGTVNIAAGYDGEFGTIKLFSESERTKLKN